MKRFSPSVRFLPFLLLILLQGCAPRLTFGIREGIENQFDFELKAGAKRLDGTAVARLTDDGGMRVVGITRFGLSLFDITVWRDRYETNSCAGFIDKQMIQAFIANNVRRQLYYKYLGAVPELVPKSGQTVSPEP